MEVQLTYLIIASCLLLVQGFLAGMDFNAGWSWARDPAERVTAIGQAILMAIAGIPVYIILMLALPIWKGLEYIWKDLSFGFIWKYMILGIEFKADPESLNRVRKRFYTDNPKWYQLKKLWNNRIVIWAEDNNTIRED